MADTTLSTTTPSTSADITIATAIRHAQQRFGERPAVLDHGRQISYTEFADQIRHTAGALVAHGIGPGVGLWAPNRLEWMLAALGAQYLGAVLVPVNTRYRGPEALDVLARTRARLLVVDQSFLDTDYAGRLRSAMKDSAMRDGAIKDGDPLPHLATIVTMAGSGTEVVSWAEFLATAKPADLARAEALADRVDPDDIADILFTSGTTGRSKGAMGNHRQALGLARAWAGRARLTAEDRYLIVNPFFHSFGYKAGYLACLLTGALIVPQSVFDPAAGLELVERERITVLPGPPTIYQRLLDDAELPTRDLSSLRLAVTGAAMVPQTLIRRMSTELRIDQVLTAYGLAEAAVVTMCTEGDDALTVATTCGRPLEWAEVQTVTDAGPTPPGVPGEVLVRGRHVMLGYLNDPGATATAIDADGWLHTGDVGILDERGYLRITDRIKDMFTVGGFNVYPAELEQVITAHPAVRDCAVIGVPEPTLGEVARAYVCLRAATTMDAEELIAYCRERLANFKVPRSVVIVDELPRNAGGKVVKTQLRQRAFDGR
jgi:acyl-CoA synthetase (AMP-forming)/AMP-acid ligase II